MLQQLHAPPPRPVTCLLPTGFHTSFLPPLFHSVSASSHAPWLLSVLLWQFFSLLVGLMQEHDAGIIFSVDCVSVRIPIGLCSNVLNPL